VEGSDIETLAWNRNPRMPLQFLNHKIYTKPRAVIQMEEAAINR
jgi:hypothetical protein